MTGTKDVAGLMFLGIHYLAGLGASSPMVVLRLATSPPTQRRLAASVWLAVVLFLPACLGQERTSSA